MLLLLLVSAACIVPQPHVRASPAGDYWWMSDPSVFSAGAGSNGVNGGGYDSGANRRQQQVQPRPQQQQASAPWRQQQVQPRPQQQQASAPWRQQQVQPRPQQQASAPRRQQQQHNGGYSNNVLQQQTVREPAAAAAPQSECPAGTKCVADHFCDENANMVSYRVDLTPAQRANRGDLIMCQTGQSGTWHFCCSTSAAPLPLTPAVGNTVAQPAFQGRLPPPAPASNAAAAAAVPASIPTGSCPDIGAMPPVERCRGVISNCWSVGQADVDCPGNALCCFDGCANTCYFGGSDGAASVLSQAIQPRQQQQAVAARPRPAPAVAARPRQQQQAAAPRPQQNGYLPPPPPPVGPWPKKQAQPQRPRQPAPQPRRQAPAPAPSRQAAAAARRPAMVVPAEQKPFVNCPAAMLCVVRETCDLEGVIADKPLNLTPQLEMLSVPLIPCVNPMNQNIDVCCRDPNYVDPWPNMNNGGGCGANNGGGGGGGGGGCGGNGGRRKQQNGFQARPSGARKQTLAPPPISGNGGKPRRTGGGGYGK